MVNQIIRHLVMQESVLKATILKDSEFPWTEIFVL
jgi:hypothetical protein